MNNIFFIIDIDGTVADSLPRVKKLYEEQGISFKKDKIDVLWNDETMMRFLYEDNMMQDGVVSGAEKVFDIASLCHAQPVFLTGRNIYAEEPTRKWLKVKLGVTEDIPLFMRPAEMKGMYTADCKEKIFKEKILSFCQNGTFIFFEDDEETIKRYAKYGMVLKAPECWGIIGNADIFY